MAPCAATTPTLPRSPRSPEGAEGRSSAVVTRVTVEPGSAGLSMRWSPYRRDIASSAAWPRTEPPVASSGGLYVANPKRAGPTAMSPPETPLLAGSPTRRSQSPEPSYMPQVAMTARTPAATSAETTRSRVTGLTPP